MIDERDLPSLSPRRHELAAIADEIMANARNHYGGEVGADEAALRGRIIRALLYVRSEASRAWLGSALTRARGDD